MPSTRCQGARRTPPTITLLCTRTTSRAASPQTMQARHLCPAALNIALLGSWVQPRKVSVSAEVPPHPICM